MRRRVIGFTLPVDMECALLLLLGGGFIRQKQHEHLLALHFFFRY
jgi:hypothetical protein